MSAPAVVPSLLLQHVSIRAPQESISMATINFGLPGSGAPVVRVGAFDLEA